jgi:hypothetical protein
MSTDAPTDRARHYFGIWQQHLAEPELEEVAVRGYGIHCMSRVIESV